MFAFLNTLIPLLFAIAFFHHQNAKSKQHRCIDEIVNRLDNLNELVVNSCYTVPYTPSNGEYQFNKLILTQTVDKFIKCAPFPFIALSGVDFTALKADCSNLFEFIELKTPIESPSNIQLNSQNMMVDRDEIIFIMYIRSSEIIAKLYKLI